MGTVFVSSSSCTDVRIPFFFVSFSLFPSLFSSPSLCCEGTQPNTVREWYKHRHDHLDEKELKKATNVTVEHFRPGRSYALKCD